MWYKHFHRIENSLILKFRDKPMLIPVFYLNFCREGVIYMSFSGKNTGCLFTEENSMPVKH